jgi:hypothetical protein
MVRHWLKLSSARGGKEEILDELVFPFVSDLGASIRGSIVRWAARWPVAPIRVSPMSLTWLRMHETEYDKHRMEL